MLLVFIAYKYTRQSFGLYIFLGVLFGLGGDYFLALPSRDFFLFGLSSFLIGHVFYIIAFLKQGINLKPWKYILLFILLAYAAFMTVVMIQRILFLQKPVMLAPIVIYLYIISAMAIMALIRKQKNVYLIVGAFIFVASDSLIALNNILVDTPSIVVKYLSYITYILAQYFIVFGAVKENNINNKFSKV